MLVAATPLRSVLDGAPRREGRESPGPRHSVGSWLCSLEKVEVFVQHAV